jgi:hypothetical protein
VVCQRFDYCWTHNKHKYIIWPRACNLAADTLCIFETYQFGETNQQSLNEISIDRVTYTNPQLFYQCILQLVVYKMFYNCWTQSKKENKIWPGAFDTHLIIETNQGSDTYNQWSLLAITSLLFKFISSLLTFCVFQHFYTLTNLTYLTVQCVS